MTIDTLVQKKDFPIFSDDSLVYLDSASTSQKPDNVINGLKNVYESSNNVTRMLNAESWMHVKFEKSKSRFLY